MASPPRWPFVFFVFSRRCACAGLSHVVVAALASLTSWFSRVVVPAPVSCVVVPALASRVVVSALVSHGVVQAACYTGGLSRVQGRPAPGEQAVLGSTRRAGRWLVSLAVAVPAAILHTGRLLVVSVSSRRIVSPVCSFPMTLGWCLPSPPVSLSHTRQASLSRHVWVMQGETPPVMPPVTANRAIPAGGSHEILCYAKLCGRGEDAQQGAHGGPDAG